MPDVPESRYADIPSEAMSRSVAGTMAVSAAGQAAPVVPGLPVAAAHADEAGGDGSEGLRPGRRWPRGRPARPRRPRAAPSRRVGGAAAGWTQAACRIRAAPPRTTSTIGLAPTSGHCTKAATTTSCGTSSSRRTPGPSYGYFLAPTTANPEGLTTVAEQGDMGNSKNHMILLQIEEIRPPRSGGHPPGAQAKQAGRELAIDPRPVATSARPEGGYRTPYGVVSARWTRRNGRFRLRVELPPNTTAEIRMPFGDHPTHVAGPGRHTFTSFDL